MDYTDINQLIQVDLGIVMLYFQCCYLYVFVLFLCKVKTLSIQ